MQTHKMPSACPYSTVLGPEISGMRSHFRNDLSYNNISNIEIASNLTDLKTLLQYYKCIPLESCKYAVTVVVDLNSG